MGQVVLVTGVSRHIGGLAARLLGDHPGVDRVVGVDVIPPPHDIGATQFVRADIRNPIIGRILERYEIDTVVHLNVIATPTFVGGRASQKEINIIGTMQLLAACQRQPRVTRLVVKSSTSVYGSGPRDPAMFTEDLGPRSVPRSGFGKDSMDVEGYVRGFTRRRPDVATAVLRLANVIGPRIRTSITDYFSLPVIPVPFGFDPRLQFCHEDDAAAAVTHAVATQYHGIVNIAGDGVLTVRQAVALTGHPAVLVPMRAAGPLGSMVRASGLADFSPDQLRLLAYGRGADTTRMRAELGFEPEYTTREAFRTFAARLHEEPAGRPMAVVRA